MVVVAVAGGTSPGVGRAILAALLERGNHTPVVLSRSPGSAAPSWLRALGEVRGVKIEVRQVDYTCEASLVAALRDVHTVICTLLARDGTWAEVQMRLLRAARCAGVCRFAPAEFGVGPTAVSAVDMLVPTTAVLDACRREAGAAAATGQEADNDVVAAEQQNYSPDKKSVVIGKDDDNNTTQPDFEWAAFRAGLFTNYLGYGCADEVAALAGNNDDRVFIWDVANMKAAIPLRTTNGSDSTPKTPRITLTELGDVGRFVAAACDLPPGSWRGEMGMAGWTGNMDDVVRVIERVRHPQKMDVAYRHMSQIQAELECATGPADVFWLQLEEMYTRDELGGGVIDPVLNQLCPDVKPMSVEDYIIKFWSRGD